MAEQNTAKVQNSENVGNSYVIQLGEQLDDLIIRIMKAQGESEDDCKVDSDKYKKYVKQFMADNPKAYSTDADGNFKWLVASTRVYIRTNTQLDDTEAHKQVKDLNNVDEVIDDYKDWKTTGKTKFEYKVGAKYTRGAAATDTSTATDTTDGTTDTPKDKDSLAKEKNLTKTDDKSGKWYYSNNEKVHYYWNGSEFIKAPGTSGAVIKEDGTFELTSGVKLRATYGTKDGWYYDQKSGNHYWYDQKTNHFINTGLKVSIDKDGTFTTASGHKLRATFGTASGWYYEVNTNPPVHWKKEGNKFYSHPEIKMIKEDGTIVNN